MCTPMIIIIVRSFVVMLDYTVKIIIINYFFFILKNFCNAM